MVVCRVSILGITILVWEGIPHNSTLDLLGDSRVLAQKRPYRPGSLSECFLVPKPILLGGAGDLVSRL